MPFFQTFQKTKLLLSILVASTALGGCASSMERAMGSAIDTALERTVGAVVGTVLDTVIETTAEAVLDVTVDVAIACIDNDKPVLSGALPNPVLNQEYYGFVHVGIRNEPYDDSYDYAFELYGDYPPGMSTVNVGRQIRLVGTPRLPGVYNFNIGVRVEDGPYGANKTKGLCRTTDNESFQWTIQHI